MAEDAPAGREALAITQRKDWRKVVKGVQNLPQMAREKGRDYAVLWGRTELRSAIDLVALKGPETPERAQALHDIHRDLNSGHLRVLCRSDWAGFHARAAFLEAVEREMLAPTYRAVFVQSSAQVRSGYQVPPPTEGP